MAKYKDILGNVGEYEDNTITISLERYNTLIIKKCINKVIKDGKGGTI